MTKTIHKLVTFLMFTALPVIALITTTGCGSGDRAKVVGKVVFNGEPVSAGSLTFAPVMSSADAKGARPASGEIQPDGSFALGTEKAKDGAAIGQHQVLYAPPTMPWDAPEWDGRGVAPKPPASPYDGLVVKEPTVEVQPGTNEMTIELVAPTTTGSR